MTKTSETPIDGNVVKTTWVDDGTLLVYVDDENGNRWCETYKFDTAEMVMSHD